MATKDDVVDAGSDLRDQIFDLSQNGNYTASQREGFARLHISFHLTLEKFTFYPAHGLVSQLYDAPLASIGDAQAQGTNCRPDSIASQQTYYGLVHKAAADLKAVTANIPRPFAKVP